MSFLLRTESFFLNHLEYKEITVHPVVFSLPIIFPLINTWSVNTSPVPCCENEQWTEFVPGLSCSISWHFRQNALEASKSNQEATI